MPDLDENHQVWSTGWDWSAEGDEWSSWWGDTPALWFGALLPRLHAWLPASTVLEIAPGYGRWTQFLKDLAQRLVIVDLTEGCIAHCRGRFADATNIEYHVNDGRSLAMVPDGSVDLAFSFDSLVHAEADVLGDYLDQLGRKLRPNGIAFLHHSNLGAYPRSLRLAHRIPSSRLVSLVHQGLVINLPAWRSESVSGDWVAAQAETAGLACVSQELVNWEYGRHLIDAISVLTPRNSCWARPREVMRNPLFTDEAKRMRRLYARSGFTAGAGASRPGDG